MNQLLAIILTKNEAEHITACIETLGFADSVLVFDSFSDDDTVKLAEQAGATVIQHSFADYASQRNAALQAAEGQTRWVLFVDADERVTPELANEIKQVLQTSHVVGWQIPRHNYIFGKLTLGAGWFPDYQMRLLRVGSARYDPTRKVHEVVILDGPEGMLEQPLVHYNYAIRTQFYQKQQAYSAYDAQILFEDGAKPQPQNYVLQPWRQFWWRYVTLKGYHDGWHGLWLSVAMAWYELRKYRLLRRLWQGDSKPPHQS